MLKLKMGDYKFHEKQLNRGILTLRMLAVLIGVGSGLIWITGAASTFMIILFYVVFSLAVVLVFTITMKHKKILDNMRK